MAAYDELIPVNLITGFLGSGKTTLLQRLLAAPELANTAVLINELGEVALDHLLLERIDDETIVLQSGCVCCAIRSDLSDAMRELYSKRERGVVPRFDRLAIETTGLADPAPIVFTLTSDPVLRHHFRLGNIVTTIDAVNGPLHFDRNPESVKQAAIADRLVLTKTDIAEAEACAALRRRLRRLNPSAPIHEAATETIDPDRLLTADIYDPARKSAEVQGWLRDEAPDSADPDHGGDAGARPHRHERGIEAFCLTYDEPLDWTAFGVWLSMLLNRHGENVLRVKGILNVVETETPVVIQGVQHVIHPPTHLERWPDKDRRSRIVFIVRDMDRSAIERSLAAFNRLANPGRRAA